MRKGWEYKKLGEVLETTSGGTPSKSHKEYYEGGTIPWLRSGEVSKGDIYDAELYITEEGLKKSSAKLFPIDTVLIAMYGATVGQVGILKSTMCTNQAICGILPNKDFHPNFLKYVLLANKKNYLKQAIGGAQPNISQQVIKSTYIPIVKFSEQESVVSELDKINELIRLKKEQLKDFDNLAQSLFYEMFGDPVENEKGWEVHLLKALCTKIGSGATPKGGSESYKEEGTSLIRSLNIHNNEFKFKDLAYIDDDQADSLNNVIVQGNDVLLNITGASVARCCIVPTEVLPARVNQHVCILRHGNLIDAKYLNRLLTNDNYQQLLQRLAKSKAATREALPKSIVDKLSIPLPPLSLQRLFAQRIEQIEREKSEVQKSIQGLETLLASRMQYWFE